MSDEKKEDVKQKEEKVVKTEKVNEEKKVEKIAEDNKQKVKTTEEKIPNTSDKKKKIITFSVIGGIALLLIIIIVAICLNAGKMSKKQAEKLVNQYTEAISEKDGDKLLDIIDTKGYVIFQEEGEKDFNKKYKDKENYIKKYIKKNDYDDLEDIEEEISSSFESKYKYLSYEYTLKEITDIKKSSKSNKIVVVKAKVKVKSSYGTDTKTLRLYTVKVNNKFKIVGAEFV